MSRITIDESKWPLVRVRYPADELTDADLEEYFQRFEEILARRERFASINDGRGAALPNSKQRKRLAEQGRAQEAQLGELLVASAVVVSNKLTKGVITAVHWISPPPHPHKVFEELGAAEEWALDVLESEGLVAAERRKKMPKSG